MTQIDAAERVTGRVPYLVDSAVPGMLHARLVRSTVPHARLVRVDLEGARRVDGVVAVLSGEALASGTGHVPTFGPVFRDRPILADGKVRYVGEPIVAIAADSIDAATDAADAVEIEYEDLPPVFSSRDALDEGAPLVHEEIPRAGPTFADININRSPGTNVCNQFKLRHGDVESGLRQADMVFEDTFTSPAVQHVPLETHVCIAEATGDRLTVWSTTQLPHILRAQLAEVFGLPLSHVRVIVSTLGGAYGAKCYPSIEPIVAALAYATRRPVRLHLTREEEFVTITKHAADITLTTGVMADGRIVARRAHGLFNTGAYADIGPRLIKAGGYGMNGPYRIPNVHIDAYAVYTNLPPAGAFRGYGISQAAWAYESQMDMIGDRLSIDPVELRMRNLLVDGDTFATGQPMHGAHFKGLLRSAAEGIGWNPSVRSVREGNIARGTGVSCILKGTIVPSTSTATVTVNADGTVNVATSTVEMGQGARTAMALIASQELSVPLECVAVSYVDTDVTPYDQQTSASRSTQAMGQAILSAIAQLHETMLREASAILGQPVDELEIQGGEVVASSGLQRRLSIADVVRQSGMGSMTGTGTYRTRGGLDAQTGQGIASDHWHQSAGAAEVAVDLETGRVEVLRYFGTVYGGRVVSPMLARLQTEGNTTFGLSQALFEEMVFDGGQLVGANLGDYMITSIKDLPAAIELDVVANDDDEVMHGLGETSLPTVMAAIGNAVARATGVRITDLPITPEKVLRALRAAEAPDGPAEGSDA